MKNIVPSNIVYNIVYYAYNQGYEFNAFKNY